MRHDLSIGIFPENKPVGLKHRMLSTIYIKSFIYAMMRNNFCLAKKICNNKIGMCTVCFLYAGIFC